MRPRYLLNFIKKMESNNNLTLKDLTLKKVVLVALTSQQRVQTIVSLSRYEYIEDREWSQFSVLLISNSQTKEGSEASDVF